MAKIKLFLIILMIVGLSFFTNDIDIKQGGGLQKAQLAGLPAIPEQKAKTKIIMTRASISKYAATGNRMANGKEYPYVGCAATSDYSIPLGSQVLIDGKIYVIKDRTASRINLIFGLTFDLYSDSVDECRRFGRKHRLVIIKIQK